jgi:cell fate regulator YaaT (PSP1 superfamily)
MKVVQIQFTPWDKIYYFDSNNIDLANGDKVVVKTKMGMEIGEVVGFEDSSKEKAGCQCPKKEECPHNSSNKKEIKPVLRIANPIDLEKIPSKEENEKALDYCKKIVEKYNLPMKLIDVHFSFDTSRLTFAFIADSRVDFRELVKDLTRHFNKTIRLQQIGIRDEAKIMGDYGHCGKPLCCRGHLQNLESITSEMAELQQCAHRGSERISGICGRLMCCLAYEQKGYEDLEDKMPPIGTKVNVDGKRGEVVNRHVLKQTVDVKFRGDSEEGGSTIQEVDLNREK